MDRLEGYCQVRPDERRVERHSSLAGPQWYRLGRPDCPGRPGRPVGEVLSERRNVVSSCQH